MEITNKYPVMIFKNQYGKYYMGMSKKKDDNNYDTAYFQVVFNKDVHIDNKTKIMIENAWLDFYNWEYRDKKGTNFYVRISKFKEIKENEKTNIEEPKEDIYEQFAEEHEELGFELPF